MKSRLKSMVEDVTTPQGRIFTIFIQFLIIVSIISFSIETLPDLPTETQHILRVIEVICVIIFSAEYLLRIFVADSKSRFIFSFFGLIDLIAILPFYVTIGVDLRSIRAFRLLRMFRLFKLVRYNKAATKFVKALHFAKEELVLFFLITVILLYLSAVGIYYFEHEAQPNVFSSVFDSLWWAVATLSTVGYGDMTPITTGGKVFTFFILLIGISVIAIPAGIIASALSKAVKKD